VPLEGLEAKSRLFSTADFAEDPRKINGFGINVIEQNRHVCPQVWADGGQERVGLAPLRRDFLFALVAINANNPLECFRLGLRDALTSSHPIWRMCASTA